MSEYQFYHFQAIDQPLSQQHMQELRDISTRAEITPTSFINAYNWGSLKANPRDLMRQYFDAHVYVANWGTQRFMVKIPRDLLDLEAAQAYCGTCCEMYVNPTHVILDLTAPEDDDAYDDDSEADASWMAALLPLREDLMRGDLRALYLAWLAGAGEDDDRVEPPLPPGLRQLSGPLQRLADFLRLDASLLQAAQQAAEQAVPTGPTPAEMATWVHRLPHSEKDALLVALIASDESPLALANRLRQRFYQDWRTTEAALPAAAAPRRRTAGQLWDIRDTLAEAAARLQAAAQARQRAEHERQAAAQRQQYLASLVTQEPQLWHKVDTLLRTTQPARYDEAVQLLRDLRDLAHARGHLAQWATRLQELRSLYPRKTSLMQRFDTAGFP